MRVFTVYNSKDLNLVLGVSKNKSCNSEKKEYD